MRNLENETALAQSQNPEDFKAKMELVDELFKSPIPKSELLHNIALYVDRRLLSRFLFINEIYQKIIPLHGVMMEFGVCYGQNMALLQSLRSIYEPYNVNRRLIGFDTFTGFPGVTEEDGLGKQSGDYKVTENYAEYLGNILSHHQQFQPIKAGNFSQLVEGDACETVPQYLKDHPETIIAFAYFDMDIYKPTKEVLEAIKPYLTKGAVIAFDEINDPSWPGETIALREALGTNNFTIYHSPFRGAAGYLIYN